MQILDIPQQTEAWYKAKAGVPSASSFNKIITSKGEKSTQTKKYMYRLAGEKITGMTEETYQSAAMQRGCELEDEARTFYEMTYGKEVKQVGFCIEEGLGGCSPDGLVDEDGQIEIKCPSMAVHVGYLLDAKLPTEYFQQVQGQLLITGRKYCDFISYFPAIKPFIIRVKRDEVFLKRLEVELKVFCKQLDEIIEKIK